YTPLTLKTNLNKTCLTFPDCPAPPIVCNGNIDQVRSYFLNPNRIPDYLSKIAELTGAPDGWSLLSGLEFTFIPSDVEGGLPETRTGEEWGADVILPSAANRRNYVPWVIVYEPMLCLYLAPRQGSNVREKAFLTATEFALAQGFVWNWHTVGSGNSLIYTWNGQRYYTGMLSPQCVQSMVFKNLPSSVMLDPAKEWFGFSAPDKQPGEAWTADEVIRYGGWGMGFLSPAASFDPLTDVLILTPVEPFNRGNEVETGGTGSYRRGTEVISSFIVENLSCLNVTPESELYFCYSVYENSDDEGDSFLSGTISPVTLPGFADGYIWFRWTIPTDFEGDCVIVCKIRSEELGETLAGARLEVPVTDPDESHTPRPDRVAERPGNFAEPEPPVSLSDSASWHEWTYVEGSFVKKTGSVTLSASASALPDPEIPSTEYENGLYRMRSGYAVYVTAEAAVSLDGSTSADAVTGPQTCAFFFPEYSTGTAYSRAAGEYETAERDGCVFLLAEAPGGKRAHYTPLWYPDDDTGGGNYVAIAEIGDCWTPAGQLSCRAASPAVSINGSLYDDWYISSR
ncbi:MAG: hypothetical protein J6V01_07430, partial [Clostridia bacterium]|nr:hypothetical protein [Clostridia bacterium]